MAESTPKSGFLSRYDWGVLGLLIVLLLTAHMRLSVGWGDPLWVDETSTGIMASMPFDQFLRAWPHDPAPPLSFLIWRAWVAVAGIGATALRIPALIFGVLTPLVALIPAPGAPKGARFTWCALLACWIPGIWSSHDARYYTLEMMLSVAQAVALMRLIVSGLSSRARHLAWRRCR